MNFNSMKDYLFVISDANICQASNTGYSLICVIFVEKIEFKMRYFCVKFCSLLDHKKIKII